MKNGNTGKVKFRGTEWKREAYRQAEVREIKRHRGRSTSKEEKRKSKNCKKAEYTE